MGESTSSLLLLASDRPARDPRKHRSGDNRGDGSQHVPAQRVPMHRDVASEAAG